MGTWLAIESSILVRYCKCVVVRGRAKGYGDDIIIGQTPERVIENSRVS